MYVIANEATADSQFCVFLYNLNFWPYLIVSKTPYLGNHDMVFYLQLLVRD